MTSSPVASPSPRLAATARRLLLPAALLAGLSALAAPPASAHGGEGVLALESFVPEGGGQAPARWSIVVRLTFAEDGHPLDDATVTVAGESDAGTPLTPVALTARGDGRFGGTIELPAGSWNLRVVSVDPPAQLALEPVTAAPPDAPSTATTSVVTDDGDGTSTAPSTAEADGTPSGDPGDGAPEDDAAGTDAPWPVLIATILASAAVLVVAVRGWRRHRAGVDRLPGPPPSASGPG
jgi:hypothetical protein